MLGKSSLLMMLLLGTGSLVGISSMYTPANVETQPQSQSQPQPQPKILVDPKTPSAQGSIAQIMEDRQLVDRLMPEIIKRLQITLNFRDNYSPLVQVKKDALASESYHQAEARCPPGFRVMGGGGQISTKTKLGDNNIVTLMIIPTSRLQMVAKMETSGEIMAYANCIGVEAVVNLKPLPASQLNPLGYLQEIPSQPRK